MEVVRETDDLRGKEITNFMTALQGTTYAPKDKTIILVMVQRIIDREVLENWDKYRTIGTNVMKKTLIIHLRCTKR